MCEGVGCMNYHETNEYIIELGCMDAYGSSDTKILTIVVAENESPVLTNLPGKFIVESFLMYCSNSGKKKKKTHKKNPTKNLNIEG